MRNTQEGRGQGQTRGGGQQHNSCRNGGRNHGRRIFPAFGKKCHSCNKLNHFEKMCRSKNVSLVQEDSDTDSEDTYVISSVSKDEKKKSSRAKAAVTKLHINKQKNKNIVKIQIDTGAQCNILPTETYVRVTGDTELKLLKPCKKEIVSYTGERRNITGKVTLPVWHAGESN